MLISVFNKKIVFAVKEPYLQATENAVKEFSKKHLPLKAYEVNKQFPLKPDTCYAFECSWNKPLGPLFEDWSNKENSFYLYVENEADVELFESLLKLHFAGSYPQYNFEKAAALKAEMMEMGVAVKKKAE